MSRTRWVKSRGFSIAAAVVFAGILAVVAVLIQATIPQAPALSVVPQSQGAAVAVAPQSQTAAVAVSPQSQLAQATAFGPAALTVVCQPGMDYNITIDKTTGKATKTEYEICPPTTAGAGAVTAKDRVACNKEDGSQTTEKPATGLCSYVVRNPGALQPYGLADGWKCFVRVYAPADPNLAEKCRVDKDASVGTNGLNVPPPPSGGAWSMQSDFEATKGVNADEIPAAEREMEKVIADQKADKDYIDNYCNGALTPSEARAESTCSEAAKRIVDNEAALQNMMDENRTIIGQDCEGATEGYEACEKGKQKATENINKIQDALKNPVSLTGFRCQDNPGESGCSGTTVPTPSPAECEKDNTKPGCSNDPNRRPPNNPYNPNTQGPPGGQRPPGQSGGSPFGNPSMNGQQQQPMSPFGGACNTRYVCSGNTLYYQSAMNYGGGSGQCQTQPMQQCPYGCQQIQQQQQAQQQGGLGTIMQALPLITSIVGMFGGGQQQQPMVNNNLPSSCATQPQQQNPNGTGTDGQPCQQQPQQPPQSQCTSGQWQPTSATRNGCTTGWQCVPTGGTGGGQPTAQLSCQPKTADVGMQISFSWSCGNSSGSAGTGFDTGGAISSSTTVTAPEPPKGSDNTATYTLTCVNLGVTASAQCKVQLGTPGIVLVTNPKKVHIGENSQIGWVTAGMKSCIVSSPDQNDFTQKNATITNVNGAAQTSPITKNSTFVLNCTTLGGQEKTATTSVTIY